jgi:zinc transporter
MSNNDGLVFAQLLDGAGGGASLDWQGVSKWSHAQGTLWLHLDYAEEEVKQWLVQESQIDPIIVESLTSLETRPRSFVYKGGMLLILRGVNLNPGADPEDMISIRCWIDEHRIITLRHRRVLATDDLRLAIENGNGPINSGSFLESFCEQLIHRMATVIANTDDAIDALEDQVLTEQSKELRQKISELRRTTIALRRYLAPQRDVLNRLYNEKVSWLSETDRMHLRETADRTMRYVEDLDAIRDRAIVIQEELSNYLTEQMNKTMYILSVVAGFFLPLGFFTGLLGINVGGVPGTETKWAFAVFCLFLIVVSALQVWFFKRKKWL